MNLFQRAVDGSSGKSSSKQVTCSWHRAKHTVGSASCVTTFDLVLHRGDKSINLISPNAWLSTDIKPHRIASNALADILAQSLASADLAAFKIFVPRTDGYWIRTNIIVQRFEDCHGAKLVKDLTAARQYHTAAGVNEFESLPLCEILVAAVGAVELQITHATTDLNHALAAMDAEIANRLSLPLLLPIPIPRYKLALVHGRYDWVISGAVYRAALEMDLELYVIAEEGHWMQDGPYTKFRQDFIPVDIHQKDATLPQRIVDAIQDYPVPMDGIVTMTDGWLIPVAHAAQALGLPTSCPSVFETCRDKYLTRLLDMPEGFECVRVEGYEGAKDFVARSKDLQFPLIVKPCAGYASEGVFKVYNKEELLEAATKANLTDYGLGDRIAIESYISGPEVDANFVIWEGEPIFLEISDQFPAEADLDDQTSKSNFLETELFLPSALPSKEQAIIKKSMLRVLSKLGVRNGVFHMEARLQNSSMEYRVTNSTRDLHEIGKGPSGETNCILIENNCRPPGTNSNTAILHTYGVELYAIHMLIALGDGARTRALSTPFLAGAQYHLDLVSIPVSKGGIMASRDATGDFFKRCPELERMVIKSGTYFQYGQEIPDPSSGTLFFVAFFMLASITSRAEVLGAACQIRKEFTFQLVQSREEFKDLEREQETCG